MYLPTVSTVRYFSSVILLPTGRQNIYCKADPNICEVYFILTAHVHTLPTTYWTFYFSRKYTIYLPDNLKTGFDVLQYYFSNPCYRLQNTDHLASGGLDQSLVNNQ